MKFQTLRLLLVIVTSALIGYYIGVNKVSFDWKNYKPKIQITNQQPPTAVQNADMTQFWDVWQRIQNSYYDKKQLDAQKLVQGAIAGMVESLGDPYTVYLPPVQNTDFKQGLAGQFEGIGAELGMKDKQIIVVAPLDGSPAQKAGIKAGDAILKVGDQPTAGWTLNQAVEKIRGQKGTEVSLLVLHKSETEPKTIQIIRDTIQVKSVESWIKKVKDVDSIKSEALGAENANDEIAYIRLSQFGDHTNSEWIPLVNKIQLQLSQSKNVKGIIIDLRNNPGGYLTEATFISSEFIKDGVVVSQDKGNGEKIDFRVNRRGLLLDIPVIVLINKGSASASEIVAGALRDHKRAILVGETSFGKGTIQEAEDLGGGAGLHVTIAKWFTPSGTWVHGTGLKPDIEVQLDSKDPARDTQLEKAIQELVQ